MKQKNINEICKIIGGNPAPKKFAGSKTGFPFLKMKDLGRYHLTNNLTDIENYIESNDRYRIIKKGSVLLPRSGSVSLNHRAILGVDSYMVSHICALEVLNEEILYNKFLYYYLTTVDMRKFMKKTTGLDAITFEDLGRIKIPLPPLSKQKRIAHILDTADALRQKNKELLAAYDELLKATFLDMFGDPVTNPKGWNVKKLEEFGEWKSGGTPLRSDKDYYEGTIPWISSGELESIYLSDSREHITEQAVKDSATKKIEIGSLLLGMYDTAALKSSINTTVVTCNQAIAFAKLDESKINTLFVFTAIQIGKEYYKSKQRGVRQKNLNLSMIKSIEVLYPPIKQQNKFAQIVENIESQKSLLKESIQESEDLFNALVQKAFKGEL